MVGSLVAESCQYLINCCVLVALRHIAGVTFSHQVSRPTCSKAKYYTYVCASRLAIQSYTLKCHMSH